MARDRRARAKSRQGRRRGEWYALLPHDVVTSDAYCALRPVSVCVLVAVAAQYHGTRNGSLTMTAADAAQYGIKSHHSRVRGLAQLVEHGLIDCTYQGGLPPIGPSRYALGWLPVDADAALDIRAAPPANRWATWQPDTTPTQPRDGASDMPGTADRQPRHGASASPATGPGQPRHGASEHPDQGGNRPRHGASASPATGRNLYLGPGGGDIDVDLPSSTAEIIDRVRSIAGDSVDEIHRVVGERGIERAEIEQHIAAHPRRSR